MVQEVSDAAAHGDRSENAEYIYGKKRLREIDRRLRYLSQRLDELVVVDPGQTTSSVVEFGATVTVQDEEGLERVYQIVGEDEVDGKLGRISMRSPMGKALLSRAVGDEVVVRRPAGELPLTVVGVVYRSTE